MLAMLRFLRISICTLAMAFLASCGGGDAPTVGADPAPSPGDSSGESDPIAVGQGADYMNGWRLKTETTYFPFLDSRSSAEYTYTYGDGFVDVTTRIDDGTEITDSTTRYRTTDGFTHHSAIDDNGDDFVRFRTWRYNLEGRVDRVTYTQFDLIETFDHNDRLLTSRSIVDPDGATQTIVYDYVVGAFTGAQEFSSDSQDNEPTVDYAMTGDAGQVGTVRRLSPSTGVEFARYAIFYDDAGNPEREVRYTGESVSSETVRTFERTDRPTLNLLLLDVKLYPDRGVFYLPPHT